MLSVARITKKHPGVDPLEQERRFLPTSEQTDAFIRAVQDAQGVDTLEQPAITNWTTYLDTEDLRCFLSCDGPIAQRLRLREYERTPGGGFVTPCYLELKQTSGTSRSKLRLAAPAAMLAQLVDGAADIDRFFTLDTSRVALRGIQQALATGHFAPCLGASYQRRCLVTGPELRVTLDEDLTFYHRVSFGAPHREALALGPARVLEVKYAGALPGWLDSALASLDEVPEFSKFRLGMLAVQEAARIAATSSAGFHRSSYSDSPDAASRAPARPSAAL